MKMYTIGWSIYTVLILIMFLFITQSKYLEYYIQVKTLSLILFTVSLFTGVIVSLLCIMGFHEYESPEKEPEK